MSFEDITNNHDGSKNISVGLVKEDGANTTTGTLFANNYRERDPVTNQPKQSFSSAGGSLAFQHAGNPSTAASVSLQHIPNMGNQATASAGIGVGSETHRVGVETFATHTMPKAHQNFTTVGARIDAQAGRVGAHAGIAHTPLFKQTEQSVGARLNLHQTPTSSFDVGVGSNRVITPSHTGNWNHGAMFNFQKRF